MSDPASRLHLRLCCLAATIAGVSASVTFLPMRFRKDPDGVLWLLFVVIVVPLLLGYFASHRPRSVATAYSGSFALSAMCFLFAIQPDLNRLVLLPVGFFFLFITAFLLSAGVAVIGAMCRFFVDALCEPHPEDDFVDPEDELFDP